MSTAEFDANLFSAEFLEDYFAECEEHLVIVRNGLLGLEQFVARAPVEPAALEELFRAFHSLKGISGMVGLQEAELLAHEMESYLRALREDQIPLSEEGAEGLIAGTRMLEEVIGARRGRSAIPDVTRMIERLAALVPRFEAATGETEKAVGFSGAGLAAADKARLASALQNGARIWRCRFTPNPALADRGVNVNTIRARLQQHGELIHSAPLIAAEGVVFEFIVAASAEDEVLAAWQDDGVTSRLYESTAPAPTAARQNGEPRSGNAQPRAAGALSVPSNLVRVDLSRLDELMRMVGDLVISRARLKDHLDRVERMMPAAEWRALQETNLLIERQLRDLREGVMRARMVPIGETFDRMRFVVRDLARERERKIHLDLIGRETEIDKFLVERLMDPLLHLVRNAVAHGLEPAEERRAGGKSPEGRLWLRAATAGETVVIEIEDDGRGIDARRVEARARDAGLLGPGEAMSEPLLLDILCAPGFSTREGTDRASGRGVGMAVVKKTIEDLGGSLAMETAAGQGTRFTLRLPLTLAITDALIVAVGGQRFAVPQTVVQEVIEVPLADIKPIEKNEIILYRGGALPVVRLARLFGLAETEPQMMYAFVIGSGVNAVGIAVDRILGLREIVVRAIADPLLQVPGIAGATELGDGKAVLILNAAGLIREGTFK